MGHFPPLISSIVHFPAYLGWYHCFFFPDDRLNSPAAFRFVQKRFSDAFDEPTQTVTGGWNLTCVVPNGAAIHTSGPGESAGKVQLGSTRSEQLRIWGFPWLSNNGTPTWLYIWWYDIIINPLTLGYKGSCDLGGAPSTPILTWFEITCPGKTCFTVVAS